MNKKTIAILVAAIVGLPMAAAASTIQNEDVVTGHTVFVNMGGFDPDLALIAGIVESKVVWFNGVPVLNGLGSGYVYAVENGQCDPTSGTDYTFQDYRIAYRDPNNVSHIVAHYTYKCSGIDLSPAYLAGLLDENATMHVWVTKTHNITIDPPVNTDSAYLASGNAGRDYNFATGVDTSLFQERDEGDVQHDGYGGATPSDVNDGDSYYEPEQDHVYNGGSVEGEDTEHIHNSGSVDLFFSKDEPDRDFHYNKTTSSIQAGFVGFADGCDATQQPYLRYAAWCGTVTDPLLDPVDVYAAENTE